MNGYHGSCLGYQEDWQASPWLDYYYPLEQSYRGPWLPEFSERKIPALIVAGHAGSEQEKSERSFS